MVLSCKTPLKCFETGFYQWEGLHFLWKFIRVSTYDPTSVFTNSITKLTKDKQPVQWGIPLFYLNARAPLNSEVPLLLGG